RISAESGPPMRSTLRFGTLDRRKAFKRAMAGSLGSSFRVPEPRRASAPLRARNSSPCVLRENANFGAGESDENPRECCKVSLVWTDFDRGASRRPRHFVSGGPRQQSLRFAGKVSPWPKRGRSGHCPQPPNRLERAGLQFKNP